MIAHLAIYIHGYYQLKRYVSSREIDNNHECKWHDERSFFWHEKHFDTENN